MPPRFAFSPGVSAPHGLPQAVGLAGRAGVGALAPAAAGGASSGGRGHAAHGSARGSPAHMPDSGVCWHSSAVPRQGHLHSTLWAVRCPRALPHTARSRPGCVTPAAQPAATAQSPCECMSSSAERNGQIIHFLSFPIVFPSLELLSLVHWHSQVTHRELPRLPSPSCSCLGNHGAALPAAVPGMEVDRCHCRQKLPLACRALLPYRQQLSLSS